MHTNNFAVYPSLRGRSGRVAFFDVEDEAAERLRSRIEPLGLGLPLYRHCELTDINALRNAVVEVIAEHDGVEVLVINAPEEVARLVLFLAAEDSSAITNQSCVVDGGWV